MTLSAREKSQALTFRSNRKRVSENVPGSPGSVRRSRLLSPRCASFASSYQTGRPIFRHQLARSLTPRLLDATSDAVNFPRVRDTLPVSLRKRQADRRRENSKFSELSVVFDLRRGETAQLFRFSSGDESVGVYAIPTRDDEHFGDRCLHYTYAGPDDDLMAITENPTLNFNLEAVKVHRE